MLVALRFVVLWCASSLLVFPADMGELEYGGIFSIHAVLYSNLLSSSHPFIHCLFRMVLTSGSMRSCASATDYSF